MIIDNNDPNDYPSLSAVHLPDYETMPTYTTDETYDFSSQPISNQEFFTMLDEFLYNLPKYLYVEKLVSLTQKDDENISMYRSILLKRAQESNDCPPGSLIQRRTTKSEESYERFANDCFIIQDFINTGDPKPLTDILVKRRTIIKSEFKDELSEHTSQLNKTIQLEMAEMKSCIQLLQQDSKILKAENVQLSSELNQIKLTISNTINEDKRLRQKDRDTINELQSQIAALSKCAQRDKQTKPATYSEVVTGNAPTLSVSSTAHTNISKPDGTPNIPSLFASIRAKDKAEKEKASNIDTVKQNKQQSQTRPNELTELAATQLSNANDKQCSIEKTQQINVHVTSRPYTHTRRYEPPPRHQRSHVLHSEPEYQTHHGTSETQAPRFGTDNEETTKVNNDTDSSEPLFESIKSRRTRRYYVGGIATYSNREGVIAFLKSKHIEPAAVKLIDTNRGSLAAKLTIYQSDSSVIENRRFWPRRMYCRRWYSENDWQSKFAPSEDNNGTE